MARRTPAGHRAAAGKTILRYNHYRHEVDIVAPPGEVKIPDINELFSFSYGFKGDYEINIRGLVALPASAPCTIAQPADRGPATRKNLHRTLHLYTHTDTHTHTRARARAYTSHVRAASTRGSAAEALHRALRAGADQRVPRLVARRLGA